MAPADTLCKKLLNVKDTVVEGYDSYDDSDGVQHHSRESRSPGILPSLAPEQLSTIKIVTEDGAKWISECVEDFTPDCERCVDQKFFGRRRSERR